MPYALSPVIFALVLLFLLEVQVGEMAGLYSWLVTRDLYIARENARASDSPGEFQICVLSMILLSGLVVSLGGINFAFK